MLDILLGLIAGLALFLYGVNLLSEALRELAGDRVREWLERFTRNRFAGVATGTAATTLLDSSSVTIILVISLVNAGLLQFENSLAVILGSNIGTTVSSQLFAFDLDKFSPAILGIGFIGQLAARNDRWRQVSKIMFAFGLVFFGLYYIGETMAPLKEHKPFVAWLEKVENPLYGAMVGAIFTVVIQSSSATMGVVIAMAGTGLITLPAGIALMLGAEVGTCADTLVATIGRSRAAVRAGIFHLLFNVGTVIPGLLLATQLAALASWVSSGGNIARQIANAHVIFNVAGVLVLLLFVRTAAQAMKKLIPDPATD